MGPERHAEDEASEEPSVAPGRTVSPSFIGPDPVVDVRHENLGLGRGDRPFEDLRRKVGAPTIGHLPGTRRGHGRFAPAPAFPGTASG